MTPDAVPAQRDVRAILHWLTDRLVSGHIDNPKTTAELLLGYALGWKRSRVYLDSQALVSRDTLTLLEDMLERRLSREPLQYIIGETEFMSLPFLVDPSTLIPRPETELLVEQVLEYAQDLWKHQDSVNIVDLGTGSGNIAISIAHYLPNARITAIDISGDALAVAAENAHVNNVDDRISFQRASVFELDIDTFRDVQVVVSNPPYVARADVSTLQEEIKNFEPLTALHDGANGFRFFPVISGQASQWLVPGGGMFFEVGDGQAETVQRILRDNGYAHVRAIPDLRHIDRVVTGTKARL